MGDTETLLVRAAQGDDRALDELFAKHRGRLLRMVQLRLDRRLRGRVDASDVIQETHVEAVRRFEAYRRDPARMPFFLWLRFLAGEKIIQNHRRQLGAQARDAGLEVRLCGGPLPDATSASLAHQLMGHHTAPSRAAVRAEQQQRVREALEQMGPLDREVLALRHFEQLSNAETALELGLQESAASKRYVRALARLGAVLQGEAP